MSITSEIHFEKDKNGQPKFEDLPLKKGDPPYSAWGLYGPEDELGMLNRLTDERVVIAAHQEVQTGVRITLDLPLSAQTPSGKAFFQRRLFHQELIKKSPRIVNDDVWTFNSQGSSQWDGLRHFAYQHEELFYNGVTMDDIHGGGTRNGIHAMAEHGIVGRGILLDFHSWRLAQNPPPAYDPFQQGSIPLKDLKAVAESQGTEIRFGDILIVRTGFTVAQNSKTEDELSAIKDLKPPPLSGVEQSEEMLKWIWENFAAVAGDQPAFECWPSLQPYALHEILLAGWGCPIGEFFDLERLSEHCKKVKRWSFFVTSEVCNVPGGVASPPNILAIF